MSPFEVVVGLVGLACSIAGAYWTLTRGNKAQKEAPENTANVQIYEGYGSLLERIDKDNNELRQDNKELRERLAVVERELLRLNDVEAELADAKKHIAKLLERLGEQP